MDSEDTEYWWPLSAVLAWIICRDPAVVAAVCETPRAADRAAILLECRLGQKTSVQAAWRALTRALGAGKATAVGDGGDGCGHQPIPAIEWRNRDLLYEYDSDRAGPYHRVMIASDDVLRLWPAAAPVEADGTSVQEGRVLPALAAEAEAGGSADPVDGSRGYRDTDAPLTPDPYRTGFPGRPTIRHLIEQEFDRRAAAGEVLPKLTAEVRALREWAEREHPRARIPAVGTIENAIRDKHLPHRQSNA